MVYSDHDTSRTSAFRNNLQRLCDEADQQPEEDKNALPIEALQLVTVKFSPQENIAFETRHESGFFFFFNM